MTSFEHPFHLHPALPSTVHGGSQVHCRRGGKANRGQPEDRNEHQRAPRLHWGAQKSNSQSPYQQPASWSLD